MVTRRTPIRRPPIGRITPDMVALFRLARAIEDDGDHRAFEAQGGRRREYLQTCTELHQLLGRTPWQADVVEVDGPPPSYLQQEQADDWNQARALRAELENAQ
jgi:hypothetical protein